MALPRAVQKQVDDVNRLVEAMKPPAEGKQAANGATKPEEGEAPGEEQELQEGSEQEGSEQADSDHEGSEGGEEAPREEPTWEQRYRVLQGKYNAEVPRLQRDLNVAQGQIQSLQQLVANMQQPKAPTREENFSPQEVRTLIKPEEVEEYGDEFLDLVGRRAQEIATPLVNSLQGRLQKLEAQVSGVSTKVVQTDKEKVIAQLADEVKDWATLNEDERFLNWLDQPDPYSGAKRGKLLNAAFEAGNAQRVIAFFKGFLKEHAAVQRDPAASGETRKARVSMDTLVAPGKPKAGTAGAQQEKRIYTRAEIQAFYADVNKGKYRSNPEEKNRQEREIFAAQNEGRIR